MFSKKFQSFQMMILFVFVCFSATVLAGKNISTANGLLTAGQHVDVTLYPPDMGRRYVVKVNFLKIESSAKAMDAYFDYRNRHGDGSAFMNMSREALKQLRSHASLDVTEDSGSYSSVGRVSDLGAFTWGKKIKFQASQYRYKATITCTEGIGLYHLVFEYK